MGPFLFRSNLEAFLSDEVASGPQSFIKSTSCRYSFYNTKNDNLDDWSDRPRQQLSNLQVPSGKRVFSLYGSQDYNINQILVKEGNFFRVFERGSAISEEGEALYYKRNGIIKLGVDFGEGYGNLNYTGYKAFLPTHRVIEILKEDKDFYYLSMDVELDYSGHKKNENTDGIQEISFDKSPDEQGAQVFADEDGVVELLKKEGLPKKALKLPVNGGIIYKIFWVLKTNVASWSKDAYSIRIQ